MADKEYTSLGNEPQAMKLFSTCTFGDLGSRKNTFLEMFAHVMEPWGFRKSSPEDLTFLRGWRERVREEMALEGSMLRDLALMEGNILLYSKNIGTILMRAEERNGDLRVGYFFRLRLTKLEFLKVFGCGVPLATGSFFLFLPLNSLCVIISIIAFALPSIIYIIWKVKRTEDEIRCRLTEIAESMGGKQITPFKGTTVKLEE